MSLIILKRKVNWKRKKRNAKITVIEERGNK